MPARINFENSRFPNVDFGDYRTVEEKARAYKEWYAEQVRLGKKVPLPDHTWEEYEAMHEARGEPAIKPDFLPQDGLGAPIKETERVHNHKTKKKYKPGGKSGHQSKKVNKSFGALMSKEQMERYEEERKRYIDECKEVRKQTRRQPKSRS